MLRLIGWPRDKFMVIDLGQVLPTDSHLTYLTLLELDPAFHAGETIERALRIPVLSIPYLEDLIPDIRPFIAIQPMNEDGCKYQETDYPHRRIPRLICNMRLRIWGNNDR